MQSLKAKKPTVCLTVGFLVHKIVLRKIILDKLYIFGNYMLLLNYKTKKTRKNESLIITHCDVG